MADVIRIKRRASPGSTGAPASLANAELAFNENDSTLYIGIGTGGAGGSATSIVPVGGQGLAGTASPLQPAATPAVGTGTKWSREDHVHPATAPTVTPATDSTTKIATTAFVQSAISAVSSGVTNINVQDGLSGGGTGNVTIGIANNGIANAKLATMPTNTIKINNTGGSATPIDGTVAQVMTMLNAASLTTRLDQFAAPNVAVSWNNQRITSLADPSAATDAANKQYVDGVAQGLDAKASARAASTANLTLSGTQTVDGIALIANDRILVKDQTTTNQNGIYIVNAGAWTRATDADTWNELISAYVFVESGTVNADAGFVCTVDQGGTLGTTAVTWTQFSGAGSITAGAGLTKTGNTLDVIGAANRIIINADNIDIAATYVGQTSITTLGTITSGTWNGTVVNPQWGGTGAASLTGYVKGNGISAMTASATIPSTDITGLGTMASQNANAVAITGGTIDGITFDGGTF